MGRIRVRPYTLADWDGLLQIQRESFPPPFPEEQLWSRAQIESHLHYFPDGALCAEVEGELVGSATALITLHDPDHLDHTWADVTAEGWISNHNPGGDTLYGVDICVRPAFRGQGVAKALYEARFALVQRLGLKRFMAGGRMPGYHHHAHRLSPREYLAEVEAQRLTDPAITPQLKAGLRAVALLTGYIADPESYDHAVLLEWTP